MGAFSGLAMALSAFLTAALLPSLLIGSVGGRMMRNNRG
jgi:putative effector of murein hydrolase